MTYGFHSTSVKDHSGESSKFSIRTDEVTAANYDAITTLMETLRDATLDITLGLHVSDSWGNRNQVGASNGVAPEPESRRETKFLVSYSDDVNFALGSMELPCANVADYAQSGTDEVDLGNSEIAAFVTALEAVHRSTYGNAITVQKITIVGRNL